MFVQLIAKLKIGPHGATAAQPAEVEARREEEEFIKRKRMEELPVQLWRKRSLATQTNAQVTFYSCEIISCLFSCLWGGGRLFGASAIFFYKTTVTQKRKVKKSIPRCEIDRLSEGYKRAVDKNLWSYKKTDFRAQKKEHFLVQTMFSLRPGKVVQTKKYPFPE